MSVIADFSHSLNRVLFMNQNDIIENPRMIAHLACNMMTSLSDKFGCSKVNPLVIAIDSKNNWRKDFYLENKPKDAEYKDLTYKGNRVKDSKFDWEAIYETVDETIDALDKYSDFQVIKIDKAEADDIIAVSSKKYSESQKVFIITSDKDMKQCIVPNLVEMYDPIKKIFITDVDVERFKKLHCMIGDKSDNILAIRPRLGEKTAEKLYPDLDTLLATNPDMRERYSFNERLICFDYIPEAIVRSIEEQLHKPYLNFNTMNLMDAFQKLNLVQMSDKISKFKLKDNEIRTELNSMSEIQKEKENFDSGILDNFFGD